MSLLSKLRPERDEGDSRSTTGQAIIVDAYTYRNAGDAAIVLATADVLKRRGVSDIRVASRHLASDRQYYERHGIEAVPPPIAFPVKGAGSDLSRGVTFVGGTILAMFLALVFQLSPRLALGVSHFFGFSGFAFLALADTVVLCGGGYLYSPDSRLNLTLLHCALTRWIARALGKDLLMMPQSIGPFRRRSDELIAAAALRAVDEIVVREERSLIEVRRLVGERRPITVCPDIALYGWALEEELTHPVTKVAANTVGLIAMDWTWARRAGTGELDAYMDKLAQVSTHLNQKGLQVHLMASSLVPSEGQDDQEIADGVLSRLPRNGEPMACINADAADVESLRLALRHQSVVISTRLHGCLLAMLEGRPAVALAYQPKATATYELLGLSELCLDVQSFSVTEVCQKVDMILTGLDEYETKIMATIAQARRVIEETYSIPDGARLSPGENRYMA